MAGNFVTLMGASLYVVGVGSHGWIAGRPFADGVTWSFLILQGYALIIRAGATTSDLLLWDPYGQPLDTDTLAVGTEQADNSGQLDGNALWRQSALKAAESAGSTLVIERGTRLYVPALGRFLQVDPVEGGGSNDYAWPTAPSEDTTLSSTQDSSS